MAATANFSSIQISSQPAGSGIGADATEGNHIIRKSQLDSLLAPLSSASHAAVTKTDTNSIAITLTGQQISAAVRRKTSLGTNEGAILEDSNGIYVSLGTGANQAARGSDLAGKANVGHTHDLSDIEGLVASLAAKAPLNHGHGTSEITGLPEILAGKSDANHTHPNATQGSAGFMSAADKIRLDALSANAGGNPYWLEPVEAKSDLPLNTGPAGAMRLVKSERKVYVCKTIYGATVDEQWQPEGRFTALIGDGASTTIDVEHGFNTKAIVVSLQDASTGEFYAANFKAISNSTLRLTFSVAPANNSLLLTILS